MVSIVLVINAIPLNCQMQSTRILLIGGVSEIWEIVGSIVADVPPEPDPGVSNETTSSGKFVATNWSTTGQLDVSHRALRASSMRSIALALAASERAHCFEQAVLKIYPLIMPATAKAAIPNDTTTSTNVIPA